MLQIARGAIVFEEGVSAISMQCEFLAQKYSMPPSDMKVSWECESLHGRHPAQPQSWEAMDDTISDILEKKKKANQPCHCEYDPPCGMTPFRELFDLKNMRRYRQFFDGKVWKTTAWNDGEHEWKIRRIYHEVEDMDKKIEVQDRLEVEVVEGPETARNRMEAEEDWWTEWRKQQAASMGQAWY